MIAKQPKQMEIWGQIVAKAWEDKSFKARLLADPSEVFLEHGLAVPDGVDLRVVESTDKVQYVNLPPKPREGELSEDELDRVAGGVVTIEYLVLGTFLGLALMTGLAAKRSPTTPKSSAGNLTASRSDS